MLWDKERDDNAAAVALRAEGFSDQEIKAMLAAVPDNFKQAREARLGNGPNSAQPPVPSKRR